MSIKEALIGVFSDDPINWLKWGIVFAILIGDIPPLKTACGDYPNSTDTDKQAVWLVL